MHPQLHPSPGNMPVDQLNAVLPEDLTMRVGIPHRGGGLTFHAFKEGYSAMVSASAFWDRKSASFCIPDATNLYELDFALDSAGFTAMRLWKQKGRQNGMAGIFPWSYAQYIELAAATGASWWSQPDLCCEPEIAANQEEVRYRIDATATLLEGVLRVVYAWQNELSRTCSASTVANMLKPPVPVLQGWSVDDYLRSLDLLQAVWQRWQPWLAPPAMIGIGSVCRRNLTHPVHGLYAILEGLEGRLPAGTKVHLFGVKGACLNRVKLYDWVASVDSMAYDFGARVKARHSHQSNTIAHRSLEMTAWMASAHSRMADAAGDQFRLAFQA